MARTGWASLLLGLTLALPAQTRTTMEASGPFEVAVRPETGGAASYSRMSLTKHYHGTLEAEATGEMLSGGDPRAGHAGYVAIETVTGSLDGKAGAFS